jgi:uncharacterized protein (DUF1800 family)
MKTQHAQHLYNRAGFGMNLADRQQAAPLSRRNLVEAIFQASQAFHPLKGIPKDMPELVRFRQLSEARKKAILARNKESLRSLNHAWIQRMASGEGILREKMTFFWHDHFACNLKNVYLAQLQNNTLRKHALGNFGDLLRAIAKDPGMLQFLNNQQNRKAHPNENFARELLELFSLGPGHYTEKDIQEAARAFTGWGFNLKGEFVFRVRQHDDGQKVFLGKRGRFDGDDIIDIILAQPQTARFITEKLYRFFVNPQLDEVVVEKWAKEFFASNYDTTRLLKRIFTSDHFYRPANRACRIKSPVEYLLSLMHLLQLRFEEPQGPLLIQRLLGQVLLLPPNVAGWPDGQAWIDSSSLLARLRISQALLLADYPLDLELGEHFAGNEGLPALKRKLKGLGLLARIDWQPLYAATEELPDSERLAFLQAYLLSLPIQALSAEQLRRFAPGQNGRERTRSLCLRLISSPEFQLC